MQIEVTKQADGAAAKPITLVDDVFAVDYNEPLIHQVVTAYLAGARSGSKANKSRSEVRGGGIKPWRQKGTGRARAGTIRSPLWKGGGVTFAAKSRDYSQKVNRKMFSKAMCSILAELLRQQRLRAIDDISLSAPKTRELVAKLKQLELNNVLIITANQQDNLTLASRNIPGVKAIHAAKIDPVSLLAFEHVLVTVDALKQIEGKLS